LRIILSPVLPAASTFEGCQPIRAEAQPSPPFTTMLLIIKALLIKLLIAASASGVIYALC
jgi:hypothetical protein